MAISPFAGKSPKPEMLVDISKLQGAYYTEIPDPAIPEQRVVFGTSGHRGSAFDVSFNEWHLLAIAQAICLYRKEKLIDGPLFLGIDTHALSEVAFKTVLEVLAANGVEVMVAENNGYTPTPVISHAILTYNKGRKKGLSDGIVITPSHNPPKDGGIKYNPPNGGPAELEATTWIEKKANEFLSHRLKGVKRLSFKDAFKASTTHQHNFVRSYVEDLKNVLDLDCIKNSKISIGVDPLGGAGTYYWQAIKDRYHLNLTIVDPVIDPTFSFMTVDWDGEIRMDPSSPYAMQRLVGMKNQFDVAFACDTDYDRHGIVTKSAGLLPPNHYLSAAAYYLFQHRKGWSKDSGIGKTVVSSQMIDRIAAKFGRPLNEVPVGFKWFVDGLLTGKTAFVCEESAGASFLRLDGSVWTTDKDGMIAALLAAEITAQTGKDPGEIYQDLTKLFGEPFYQRIDAVATAEQKKLLKNLQPENLQIKEIAGEKIQKILNHAPNSKAPIGGLKVCTESSWFVIRPSGTEDIYKIYAESFKGESHLKLLLQEVQVFASEIFSSAKKTEKIKDREASPKSTPESESESDEVVVESPFSYLMPIQVKGTTSLMELALDLRWSWNHEGDPLWKQLDPELWKLTRSPWIVLQTVSRKHLEEVLADPEFQKKMNLLLEIKEKERKKETWFQKNHSKGPLNHVAYFSMEFMLNEVLPIYSGGLGNVAGDQLKAASDLGIPVIGVGLLYQRGYFRQIINNDGAQEALFPYNAPGQLPVIPLRRSNGEWLRIKLTFPGYAVWLRSWCVQIGRSRLYLLDSNDPANHPIDRGITGELYGGSLEMRLKQELILGIGGWRLLRELGLAPEVCHLNEGHAAFAILERAYHYMQEMKVPFDVALTSIRAGNLFTTHTAVAAGFDLFPPDLIKKYLGNYTENKLNISIEDLLALGRQNPENLLEDFNMAYLAIRGSGCVNGVSRLHGEVSRRIFEPIFPSWPEAEVPVGHVTNGVHMSSWASKEADDLWTKACGKERWQADPKEIKANILAISDKELWDFRSRVRLRFVEVARARYLRQLAIAGAPPKEMMDVGNFFNPNALLLGFARRFATYKRPNLLLHNPERFFRILTNPDCPVQLFLAGKAHPADKAGQLMIQEWHQFIRDFKAERYVLFLSDYDMLLTEQLVRGVDVWINTPQRPWEACGTSGMKVLVNGGLNLSELDGWWAEAYTPEIGWALGDGLEHNDPNEWNAIEANTLYDLLEDQIIPEFYCRNKEGIPQNWIARIRKSMANLTSEFSANRAVRQYCTEYYIPAAKAFNWRIADNGKEGREMNEWQKKLQQQWSKMSFGKMEVETNESFHTFAVQVYLNGIDPEDIRIELYADATDGVPFVCREMENVRRLPDIPNGYEYRLSLPADRLASCYTPRIVPYRLRLAVPLEAPQILWQR